MDVDGPELNKTPANYVPLSPISFLTRSAQIFADRTAVIHGQRRFSYREFHGRCCQLANSLRQAGIGPGDTVAILAANVPALLEAHYAVPMIGAVLNPINVRLDSAMIALFLQHGGAKLMLADRGFGAAIVPALESLDVPLRVIEITDPETEDLPPICEEDYEAFIAQSEPEFTPVGPQDEWQSICLLYTSGTTGDPKGAVYSHRGAYLGALANALTFKLDHESVYLWTLPMFHCCGWTYTWAVTAAGGTHVCLRAVDTKRIFELIAAHDVTHMCGAPIVLNMLIHAPDEHKRPLARRVNVATGGASPPSAVIAAMEGMGFEVLHLYGTTESYGPSSYCAPMSEWRDKPDQERFELMARQGLPNPMIEELIVADPDTGRPVPQDGTTIGEVMLRGNIIMKGYLDNPGQTDASFEGGWYHSGDLAVWHPDGTFEVKDRSKDIIISGGESISSLEIEDVLFRHPEVMEAAVVAKPDEKWGETPCAFIDLKPGAGTVSKEDIIAFCRDNMAGFKVPRYVVFGPLPKTSTGKIQKFVLRDRVQEAE